MRSTSKHEPHELRAMSRMRAAARAGPRTAKAMADAALGQLASAPVAAVAGSDELAAFRAGSGLPKVLLASAKAAPTPLYRSLALRFKGRLAFATVRRPPGGRSFAQTVTDAEIMRQTYQISHVPSPQRLAARLRGHLGSWVGHALLRGCELRPRWRAGAGGRRRSGSDAGAGHLSVAGRAAVRHGRRHQVHRRACLILATAGNLGRAVSLAGAVGCAAPWTAAESRIMRVPLNYAWRPSLH